MVAVTQDPQAHLPLGNEEPGLEPRDTGGHGVPVAPLGRQLLKGQPVPVPDLDRVGTAASREQAEDIALEKRRVHAELQGEGSAESSPSAGAITIALCLEPGPYQVLV